MCVIGDLGRAGNIVGIGIAVLDDVLGCVIGISPSARCPLRPVIVDQALSGINTPRLVGIKDL